MKNDPYFRSIWIHFWDKWYKYVFIVLLATALILGLGLMRSVQSKDQAVQTVPDEPSQAELSVQRKIDELTKAIEDTNGYLDNSLLAKMNLVQTPTFTIRIALDTEKAMADVFANRIATLYAQPSFYDIVRRQIGQVDTQYINELISTPYNPASRIVDIKVYYEDMKVAEAIANKIYNLTVEAAKAPFYAGALNIEKVSALAMKTDNTAFNTALTKLTKERDLNRTALEAEVKKLKDLQGPVVALPQFSPLKYGLAGFLIGGVIALGLLFASSISNKSHLIAADLKVHYRLPILFALASSRKTRRFEKSLTEFLTPDQAARYLVQYVELFTPKKILMSGPIGTDLESAFKENQPANLLIAPKQVTDPETFKDLHQAEAVILVLDPYQTSHQALQDQLSLLNRAQKEVLGVVLS